jgi:tetratricopeptide (TPR) repeat protein
MSLTTVAAHVVPDPVLARVPASTPERFQRSDFIAAAITFLVTFGVYVATLAPNVGLLDSGELITAAAKFGVGHPPGYPFWTICGFLLTHLLPFGNLAWKMNLLDALFGALSNAVLTLLVCHSGRWLLQRWTEPEHQAAVRPYVFYAAVMAGIVIGFSDVMWSQAVIAAVHGTLNALFMNLVLLFFYLWMIEPQKTHRLVLTVFVFALGLTNHHTLVQIIPAFLLGAFLLQATPSLLGKPGPARQGTFWSLFIAVNLFSLSLLVYISWLSQFNFSDPQGANELQTISQYMAKGVFITVAVISFFYVRQFNATLFCLGGLTAISIFAFAYYVLDPGLTQLDRYTWATAPHFWMVGSFTHPGWLQGLVANARPVPQPMIETLLAERHVAPFYALVMLFLGVVALGLLYTSTLNRRMVIAVFIVGWIGLAPYSYEVIASSTNPPMNWGVPKSRGGFFYSVSREQYPKSLPTLIKSTFGKELGVIDPNAQLDATIGLPDYWGRLWKTAYYYCDNLQLNFTVPLIFLTLAVLIYIRRCDWPQINWYIFLGAAFFLVGFMLQIIAPQESFDFERNLQYKVFHLQSHCIFVLLMAYGALALMVYLHELMPEVPQRLGVIGFGPPALFLSLLPLWSNFDACSQANHWFGYFYGADMMRDMDKNAVYYGGSDPGRFVPTYMAFVESQQPDAWKGDWAIYPDLAKKVGHGFDRRDVTVITQNALCDNYYAQYIREQYDPRFRPKTWTPFEKWLGRDTAYPVTPVTSVSDDELRACWDEYSHSPEVVDRTSHGEPMLRPGSNDVFELNGVVAKKIFEKNKKDHTFYLEQSVPLEWTYPYLLPFGLIFKLNPEPMDKLPDDAVAADREFWDAYSQKLLNDPHYRVDNDAVLVFGKLCYWHADLYRSRGMKTEEEYFLRMALQLCPQLQDAVYLLSHLLTDEGRFEEAMAVVQQAEAADPRNDAFPSFQSNIEQAQAFGGAEIDLKNQLARNPYDIDLNVKLGELYQQEGKYSQLNDSLRNLAGLTNWNHDTMAPLLGYYVRERNLDAAIAFVDARSKIEPGNSQLVYEIAALHAMQSQNDDAITYLAKAFALDPTNAPTAAKMDPNFASLQNDPRFEALFNPQTNAPPASTNAAPAVNAAPVQPAPTPAKAKHKKPAKKD